VRYHLAYATMIKHRSELETSQLVLTHLGPDMLSHLDEVDQVTASDGLVLHT